MSALEEIEAAIRKLNLEREEAMTGPWRLFAQGGYPSNPEHPAYGIEGALDTQFGSEPGYMLEHEDAELIVTLHRTIDAQLAVLALAARYSVISTNLYTQAAVVLARAINGTP